MVISDKEVKDIAQLARLELNEQDLAAIGFGLRQILEFVQQMDAVDTTNIEPLAHPLELDAHRRSDEVLETNLRDTYQRVAPRVETALYLVPKVVE